MSRRTPGAEFRRGWYPASRPLASRHCATLDVTDRDHEDAREALAAAPADSLVHTPERLQLDGEAGPRGQGGVPQAQNASGRSCAGEPEWGPPAGVAGFAAHIPGREPAPTHVQSGESLGSA